jgi:hypothetical protein
MDRRVKPGQDEYHDEYEYNERPHTGTVVAS